MDLEKVYHDADGNECNILQLVKRCPSWAANIIQHYEALYGRKVVGEREADDGEPPHIDKIS